MGVSSLVLLLLLLGLVGIQGGVKGMTSSEWKRRSVYQVSSLGANTSWMGRRGGRRGRVSSFVVWRKQGDDAGRGEVQICRELELVVSRWMGVGCERSESELDRSRMGGE